MKDLSKKLYLYFERHLNCIDSCEKSQQEFVVKVVNEYFSDLKKMGFILDKHIEEVRSDIEADVLDMLRKKTYGHFNLRAYQFTKSDKKKN